MLLAVIGFFAACVVGVIAYIVEKRNISDYERIFSQSRVLWMGEMDDICGL